MIRSGVINKWVDVDVTVDESYHSEILSLILLEIIRITLISSQLLVSFPTHLFARARPFLVHVY